MSVQLSKHPPFQFLLLFDVLFACAWIASSNVIINDNIGHSHPHFRWAKTTEVVCPACLDARLVQHYNARGCTPIIRKHCECPSRFKCPAPGELNHLDFTSGGGFLHSLLIDTLEAEKNETETGDCHYNGHNYHLGDTVPTHDVCRICICNYLPDGQIGVDCETKIECPVTRSYRSETFGRKKPYMRLMCYDYYEHNKCCPRQECMPVNARTGRTLKPRKTCSFLQRQFQIGEKLDLLGAMNELLAGHYDRDQDLNATLKMVTEVVEHKDTPKIGFQSLVSQLACLSCICTEHWNKTGYDTLNQSTIDQLKQDTASCQIQECQLNLDPRFRSGCIPVYTEEKCCPINYICRKCVPLIISNNIFVTLCIFFSFYSICYSSK